ncbi:hypothetical protein [Streptomyces sp. NBC_00268]|uniref:hypothetical protein n=1 Tax=Streptomyces sp. NBC_00268 TaxID=2975695 RepID=UPI0022535D60|nr:hypothetical protein [Streptomyces sp. NBC_00268]MCX5190642.1 hypothetical protein [Streptomyces sp. NBC_00268]
MSTNEAHGSPPRLPEHARRVDWAKLAPEASGHDPPGHSTVMVSLWLTGAVPGCSIVPYVLAPNGGDGSWAPGVGPAVSFPSIG